MSVMRNRSKGVRFAPFGLGLCVFALIPTEIGYQDIASLLARQPGVAERWQKRVSAAASTIQVATYSFGRPIGTALPQPPTYLLARLDNQGIDITGSLTRNPITKVPPRYQASDFPKVDRTLKGDRLVIVRPEPAAPANATPSNEDPSSSNALVAGAKTAAAMPPAGTTPLDPELAEALKAPPLDDSKMAPDAAPPRGGFSVKTASLFFGSSSIGAAESMERWQPGQEPTIVTPGAGPDPDMKIKTRAKSEKCLAEAVYFEARGEAVRGQIAVAQVVMNRAFSGFYPTTVCAVVYQNKHHHLACQFTFACDNVADVVREPDMWVRARKIAKAMLDGQLWLPEVGKSTHYHAYWVRPSWVNEMKKMYKFGVHTFYRPRAWGDGSEAPSWGTPAQTAEISAELAEAAKSSAELSDTTVRR